MSSLGPLPPIDAPPPPRLIERGKVRSAAQQAAIDQEMKSLHAQLGTASCVFDSNFHGLIKPFSFNDQKKVMLCLLTQPIHRLYHQFMHEPYSICLDFGNTKKERNSKAIRDSSPITDDGGSRCRTCINSARHYIRKHHSPSTRLVVQAYLQKRNSG